MPECQLAAWSITGPSLGRPCTPSGPGTLAATGRAGRLAAGARARLGDRSRATALSDCTGRMERYRAPVPDSRWPERVCVCVLACGCVLACLLRLACLHACVRACACVCDTVCARARVRMCARLCVSVYVRACVCVRASACVRACARMCAGHARARARDGLCGGFEGDCCRCCCSICAFTCLRDSDYQLHMNPGQTPHPYLHTSYTRLTHESR